MWAESVTPHFGSLPLKKWLMSLVAAVAVAFLYTIAVGPVTHAADASWSGGSIKYGDDLYQGPVTSNGDSNNGLVLANGVKYYFIDKAGKRDIIYFDGNQDPAQATTAHFVEYTFSPPDNYSQPSSPKQISISQSDGGGADADDGKERTYCAVSGIGYMLCPLMGFISEGMDWVFEQIQVFMKIDPLTTGKDSSLYKAWNLMRSFANIAFVGAFLVFIYSYLTGMGVSQYDLRKMIPRLIIAAVVVNISYVICALAVDLSNVAGASLQELFITIRNQLATSTPGKHNMDGVTWTAMTAYILSGGTIAAAAVAHVSAVGSGVIYLLVPVLSIASIAIVVTVAVLAARQALIVILIIISPIAFVAFALPNTSKYFDKWREVFQTMLLLYPIFSVLYGGSQLAGYLIAQNAQRPEVLILGMFVQVAPLVITPFLIKFSGGLLGRIANMVNDPAKGAHDKVKGWAAGRRELSKDRRLAENRPFVGIARKLDNMKRNEESLKKHYQAKRKRAFDGSELGRRVARRQMLDDDQQAAVDNMAKAEYEFSKRNDSKMQVEAAKIKIAEMELDVQKARSAAFLDELKTDAGGTMHSANNVALASLSKQMRQRSDQQQIAAHRAMMAESAKRTDYADRLIGNQSMQLDAAGVGGERGKLIAAAHATQAIREDHAKSVAANTELLAHYRKGIDSEKMQQLAYGASAVVGEDSSGRKFTFDASEIGGAMHEAAAVRHMKETNVEGFLKYMRHVSDHQSEGYASLNGTVKDIARQDYSAKIPFVTGKSLDLIDQGRAGTNPGNVKGEGAIRLVTQTIEGGKTSPEKIAGMDAFTVREYIKAIEGYNAGDNRYRIQVDDGTKFAANASKLVETAREALSNPLLSQGRITDSARPELEALSRLGRLH